MATLLSVHGVSPAYGEGCWFAPTSTLIGQVTLGDDCTVWFGAILRGDVCSIRVGNKTNIQDGVVIHGTYQKSDTIIGDEVSIGHGAVIHGCTIHDQVLVGMKAVIMDHAVVESNVVIGAGAVVLEGAHLESGYVYAGVPAKRIKPLDETAKSWHITRTAAAYLKYASWYK
ncbi:MAG: gamma carbonic anhydrase family protein [Bacteroidota bacterium]